MTKPTLPRAISYDQLYFAAILDELRAIRALLQADRPPKPAAPRRTRKKAEEAS